MKPCNVASAVMILIGLVLLMAAAFPAEAGKKFTEGSLDGTYYYTTTQVRDTGDPVIGVEYCSGYGTVEFYGDGTSLIAGYDRCSIEGTRWNSEPHEYSVTPDGEVIIWRAVDPADTTHCQLLDNGKMLMCDGVGSTPDVLSFNAVAMLQ